MIYLAGPYTDSDPAVREARFQGACRQAAEMLRCGIPVWSPIAYSHALVAHGLPLDWEFWERFDRAFLEICSEVWVLMLDGWRESKGVQAEIGIAGELGKPVIYVEPDLMPKNTPAGAGVFERKR
ncbi:MAG: DUF1937 family protein [Planctomycetota bacterium]